MLRTNVWQIFFQPTLPYATNELLNSPPSLTRVELGRVNTIWNYVSAHLKWWFGVSTGSSFGSSLMVVSGLKLSKLSTPVKQVCSSSSVTSASCKMAEIARFAALIKASNTPPKCGAAGGFHYHSTPLFAVVRRICS